MALTKEDLQAIAEIVGQSEKRMTDRMDKGFDRLEDLINVAAKDAARTEKALREHLEQPHIA